MSLTPLVWACSAFPPREGGLGFLDVDHWAAALSEKRNLRMTQPHNDKLATVFLSHLNRFSFSFWALSPWSLECNGTGVRIFRLLDHIS